LVYHPSLLEPDLVDIRDVLLASEDENLADATAKAEGMAELAREVAQNDMDERWDRRHEEYLWRLMGEGGKEAEDRKVDPEVADDEESMEDSTTGEDEDDKTMTGDSEDDMGRDEEEVRWDILRGPSRGFNSLRLVAVGGDVKSQPFILDSDDDEKMAMSEDD
jgi:archaellum component FlaD/FlaE